MLTEPASEAPSPVTPGALVGAAARGGLWLAATMIVARASGFLALLVLARLVTPAEFGLLAMANAALTAMAMVSELGLGAALVQRPRGPEFEAAASTAFWTNVAFGWLLVGLNGLCAPLVAWFFADATVTPILQVMGLQFGTSALGAVHHALLTRELDYRRKLLPDAIPGVVSGVVAIGGALQGWGVWSLVAGAQVGAVVGVVVVWHVCRWRPRRVWDRRQAGMLLGYGRHIIGAELLRYITQNVDYLVVGRLFGPAALGVYTLAFNLANLVVSHVGFLFARVAFPLFSRLQADPRRLRDAFLRMETYLALLALPAMAVLGLLAREFVAVAYGPRWADAVTPLRVLALMGTVRVVAVLSGDVVRAVGRPELLSRLGLLAAPLTVLGTVAGAQFGLTGVAVGLTAATTVTAALLVRAALGLLGIPMRDLAARLAPVVRAAVVTGAAVLGMSAVLTATGTPAGLRLAAGAGTGAAVFWVALGRERVPLLEEARRVFRSMVDG